MFWNAFSLEIQYYINNFIHKKKTLDLPTSNQFQDFFQLPVMRFFLVLINLLYLNFLFCFVFFRNISILFILKVSQQNLLF